MKEGEPSEPPYELSHDDVFETSGPPFARGSYRIRIYERPDAVPVVLAAEVSPEHGRGLSTVTQFLAADVLARYFTSRLWEEQPLRWIEEETKLRNAKGNVVTRREYWEVAFDSFLPRRAKLFGDDHYLIVESTRRPVKQEDLEATLGQKIS